MIEDAKTAYLKKDWMELERICEVLGDFSNSLSQLHKERVFWYRYKSKEEMQ